MPLPIGPFTVPPQPDEDSWFARFLMGLRQEQPDQADSFWQSEPEPEGYDRAALDKLMTQWEMEARVKRLGAGSPGSLFMSSEERERVAEQARLDRLASLHSPSYQQRASGIDVVPAEGRDIELTRDAAHPTAPTATQPDIAPVSQPDAPGEMPDFGDVRSMASSLSPIRSFSGGSGTRLVDPGASAGPPHPPPQPILASTDPSGLTSWESADGSIRASMAGPRPNREEAQEILKAGAFNYQPVRPGPPVPTTVTASRFDPAKEAFVPIGPPPSGSMDSPSIKRDTGVRESYSAVPYDPEGERIRAMEREMQDLQRARGGPADPLAKERFRAQQDRQLLLDKAGIDQMSDADRKRSILEGVRAIGEEEAALIGSIQASTRISDKEKLDRIAAAKERTKRLLQAFGIKSQEPTF